MLDDEDLLLAVLNSAPLIDGAATDQLDDSTGSELLSRFGGTGTDVERAHLRRTRDALQGMVRHERDAVERLAAIVETVALLPVVIGDGMRWDLDVPADEQLGARGAGVVAIDGRTAGTSSALRQRRVPPLPHRPQSAGNREMVLQVHLREQDESSRPRPPHPWGVTARSAMPT